MRRSFKLALIAVGALFLILAPLIKWYAYPAPGRRAAGPGEHDGVVRN
jgi:hypothetical protein